MLLCHGNYSKFVREGYQVIGNSDANTLTAYNASTHSLVIVTTNSSSSSTTVSYNLSGFSSVGSSATPYQTSASENLQQLSAATISNKTFSSALPGQSITTFVIPNVYTAGGGVTPTPTPTPGGGNPTPGSGTFNPNSHYRIVNRNSGQVLDVTSASTASGALIDQWPSNSGANQLWRFVAVNGGYKLVNVNSSKVLDDPGASKTNGTQLDQATDTNSSKQWWNIVSLGSGYYSLVNQSSGEDADVSGASTANGAAVIQWPSTGAVEPGPGLLSKPQGWREVHSTSIPLPYLLSDEQRDGLISGKKEEHSIFSLTKPMRAQANRGRENFCQEL